MASNVKSPQTRLASRPCALPWPWDRALLETLEPMPEVSSEPKDTPEAWPVALLPEHVLRDGSWLSGSGSAPGVTNTSRQKATPTSTTAANTQRVERKHQWALSHEQVIAKL